MHDSVDAFECTSNAILIAHVTNKESNIRILVRRKLLRHLELFQLVPRENHQTLNLRKTCQHGFDERLAERAGTPGNKDTGLSQETGF